MVAAPAGFLERTSGPEVTGAKGGETHAGTTDDRTSSVLDPTRLKEN